MTGGNVMMPLNLAGIDEDSIVVRITGKPEVKRHLENLGFTVGSTVKIVSETAGNVIVSVRESRVAISREMAGRIFVK